MANSLFDIIPVLPEGFSYIPDFITAEEETRLIEIISQYDLHAMQFHLYVAKRNVLSFGHGWNFTQQQLIAGNPIPTEFNFLLDKIATHLNLEKKLIAQFLITEYPVAVRR